MVKQTSVVQWNGQYISNNQMGRPFTFSGSADNGLGSPTTTTTDDVSDSGTCAGVKVLKFSPVPTVITLPAVSVSANVTGSCTIPKVKGNVSIQYSVQAIAIHAHPTMFQQNGDPTKGPGSLQFSYSWQSTSGNLMDLGQCYLGEYVTYFGNPGTYQNGGTYSNILRIPYGIYVLPKPPFGTASKFIAYNNPTLGNNGNGWQIATPGQMIDTHSITNFHGPYANSEVVIDAKQCYGFRCETCMGTDPPGYFEVLMGGITIHYSFRPNLMGTFYFDVTKSGFTSDPLEVIP